MKAWIASAFPLILLACLVPADAPGYSLSPSLLSLRPSGDGSSGFIQLANRTTQPVAVELAVQSHHRDLAGRELRGAPGDAEEEFLIYPAQLVLLPGDEAGVQVRWIGPPRLDAEKAFTLVARQVPIPRAAPESEEPAAGVRLDITVLLNYEVRIYVTPPGARPRLVVASVADSADHRGQIDITIINQGTARASLAEVPLVLEPGDPAESRRSFTVPAGSVPALKTPILSGERRRVTLPRPDGFPSGPVRVSFSE